MNRWGWVWHTPQVFHHINLAHRLKCGRPRFVGCPVWIHYFNSLHHAHVAARVHNLQGRKFRLSVKDLAFEWRMHIIPPLFSFFENANYQQIFGSSFQNGCPQIKTEFGPILMKCQLMALIHSRTKLIGWQKVIFNEYWNRDKEMPKMEILSQNAGLPHV